MSDLLTGLQILPMVIALHTSDFTRGPQDEVTQDFVGGGVVLVLGDVEIEGALGYKETDCKFSQNCNSSAAGYASARWIIGGRKR
jgi:hypothetical protein